MAYIVDDKFRQKVYSGGAIYDGVLTIINKDGEEALIENKDIKSINVSNPIIDTSKQYFYIGTFISNKIEVVFRNINELDLTSRLKLNILVGEEYDIPIGIFNIETSPEDYHKGAKITALDNGVLFKPNVDFSEIVPTTLENLLKWLCDYFGVKLGTYPKSHPNLKSIINVYDNYLSGKYYISYIAELLGCFAKIGRQGELNLIPIKRTPVTTINGVASKSFEISDVYNLTGIVFDNGITIIEKGNNTGNVLTIRNDNILIGGTDEELDSLMQNIYDSVKDLTIYGIKCENYADISLDAYDIVNYDIDGTLYPTYYSGEYTYEQSLMGTIDVQIPTKNVENTTNSVGTEEANYRRLRTDIDQANGKIAIISEKTEILSDEKLGHKSIFLKSFYGGTIHKFTVRGFTDIPIIDIQKKGLISLKAGTIKAGVTQSRIKQDFSQGLVIGEFTVNDFILYVMQDDNIVNEYKLPLKQNLYRVGNIYDEFICLEGKCSVIHRIGITTSGILYVLKEEYVEELDDLIIEAPVGDITLVTTFNSTITCQYLVKNEFTDTFASHTEVKSEIEISQEGVLIEAGRRFVDKTDYVGDEIIAKINVESTGNVKVLASKTIDLTGTNINMTADNVKITSNNLSIDEQGNLNCNSATIRDGAISNGKFTVDKEGNMTCSNAQFTNGTITSPNFNVDANGNMSCNNATFTGTISSGSTITGSSISSGAISGSTITGTTINASSISMPNFSVDTSGNMSCSNASISGAITGSSITGSSISTTNFNVDTSGNMSCSNADITGGKISLTGSTNKVPKLIIAGTGYNTSFHSKNYIMSDGFYTEADNYSNTLIRAGISSRYYQGAYYPAGYMNFADALGTYNSGDTVDISSTGINVLTSAGGQPTSGTYISSTLIETPRIKVLNSSSTKSSSGTYISSTSIETPSLIQGSLERNKKNFEEFKNGLEEVKKTNIYKYNLKHEEDGAKKHIGFVIGENYSYSHEITAENEQGEEIGVEDYSMISVCLQAIKELNEKVELLEKKVKDLEEKNEKN